MGVCDRPERPEGPEEDGRHAYCEFQLSESGDWVPVSCSDKYGDPIEGVSPEMNSAIAIATSFKYWEQPRDGSIVSTHRMEKSEKGLFALVSNLFDRGLLG